MARSGWALAFLAALPLLAGCVSPGDAIPEVDEEPIVKAGLAVPPSHLAAGTFYAFRHAGGSLGLGILPGGRAQLELFDGQDQRLGQLSLSDALAGGSLELQNMAAGDYVVRMLAVNGTLRISSGGAAPALRPLPAHVERHVLLQAPRSTLPLVPLPDSSAPVERGVDLQLLRAPTSVRILVDGSSSQLEVELRSSLGPVVEAHSSGFNPFVNTFSGSGLYEVGSEFHGENVRDGRLTGRVLAQDLQGSVVLEAASFSRAEPLAAPAIPTGETPGFTYGTLPDGPVRFQTGPRATQLFLRANPFPEGNRTWVVLFDDHGKRVGTVSLHTGATLALPVSASAGYIAVRLRGNATLGADGAPGDFELHPMQVRQQVVPFREAGDGGEYGQAEAEADGAGVYSIVPHVAESDQDVVPFFGPEALAQCGGSGMVRVVQAGETLGYWEQDFRLREVPAASDAELRLRDGPLRIVHDGFGTPECPRPAALVKSFEA